MKESGLVAAVAAVIIALGILFLGSQGAFDADPATDSAGLVTTPLPYRAYTIAHKRVIAFELYGMKCVAMGVALDCEDTSK